MRKFYCKEIGETLEECLFNYGENGHDSFEDAEQYYKNNKSDFEGVVEIIEVKEITVPVTSYETKHDIVSRRCV